MIAFVGSVFSPYYAWQRWRRRDQGGADPGEHCAINVALYGGQGSRWTMTERGRRQVQRDASQFRVGPSRWHWQGGALHAEIDEWAVPLPRRVRGRVRVRPLGLCRWHTALDAAGRHRWGPIAPCARIEVAFDQPALSWRGHAYVDANAGSEPIDRPFREWDWARATLRDGSTAVVYDVQPRDGPPRTIAERFSPAGEALAFDPPPRQRLPRSRWLIERQMRSEAGTPPRVLQPMEDTPFYARSKLSARLLDEDVTAVHETLDLPRVASVPVRLMLPFRMPRRA